MVWFLGRVCSPSLLLVKLWEKTHFPFVFYVCVKPSRVYRMIGPLLQCWKTYSSTKLLTHEALQLLATSYESPENKRQSLSS